MNRKLIPYSGKDRFAVALAILLGMVSALLISNGHHWLAIWYAALATLFFTLAYVLQDQPKTSSNADDYKTAIARIESVSAGLRGLGAFLEKEKRRAEDAQSTIVELESRRQELEPIVRTNEHAVEAILSAHGARVARNAWKERVYGFIFGIAASLVASGIYDRLK